MAMGKKEARQILKALQAVQPAAKLEYAHFEDIAPEDPVLISPHDVTDFIHKRTRLYRDTWIVRPLNDAISALEKHV